LDAKTKWNTKYFNRLKEGKQVGPNPRLKNFIDYLKGGTAIELACGLGGNCIFLSHHGYVVEAVDISDVAIHYLEREAARQKLTIRPHIVDLSTQSKLEFKKDSIDIAVITYYLDRPIIPYVMGLVKKHGFIFMETYFKSPLTTGSVSEKYKLAPGELLTLFGAWQILYYEENEKEGRQTIFARKP
jgi:tellurite methyltransferase